ncbi:MAG: zinc ribbon domain-containing protein [Planctomycetes bacterium]|nr:zinc ribbon domain-containing protein [Planctomycetota bacterium]
MKRLISCDKCDRRYDATGREVGTRVRCRCGEILTIEQARGHEAEVVRCSSCGAPREQGTDSCGHCHSDFTLHEKDMHSVCPKCLARVSDRAKFCHHCGEKMTAEMMAGDETPLVCPGCVGEQKLTSRQFGAAKMKVPVFECGKCGGLWLGNESFSDLIDRVAEDAESRNTHRDRTDAKPKPAAHKPQAGPLYRKCAFCQKMMTRRHHGSGSGVIIDICREHGVWFDTDELPQIIAWMRAGGQEHSDRRRRESNQAAEQTDRIRRSGPPMDGGYDGDRIAGGSAVDVAMSVLRDLFF